MDLFHGEKIEKTLDEVDGAAQQVRLTAAGISELVQHADECVLIVKSILTVLAQAVGARGGDHG